MRPRPDRSSGGFGTFVIQKVIDASRAIRLTVIVRQLQQAVEEEPMKRILLAGAALALALAVSTSAGAADKKQLAFVVNGASDFWKLAEAGVKKAQENCPTTSLSSNIQSRPPPPSSSG